MTVRGEKVELKCVLKSEDNTWELALSGRIACPFISSTPVQKEFNCSPF